MKSEDAVCPRKLQVPRIKLPQDGRPTIPAQVMTRR